MSKIVLNDVTNLSSLSVINDNFDKIEQELQNKVHYRDNPEGEPNTFENDVDLNGNNIYNVENLTVANSFTVNGKNIEEVVDDAIAGIEQSAESAANSATAAANSAASSSSSAASATASATTATTKASEASTSATNAGSSATAAASSATASAASATAASGSATSAASSASTATTQASNASSSASAAATSATNASNSATASASSATDSANSASSSAASAAAAALALDNFDDRYLGVKTAAPTLDNDGNALVAGALYFNSGAVTPADKGMWVYDGGTWIAASAASQAIMVTYEYVATQGQTTFTGADANALMLSYTVGSIVVTLNGVKLRPGNDYTASTGNSVVLLSGAAAGDDLVVDAFATFDIANTYTQAQADARYLSSTNGSVTQAKLAAGVAGNGPAFSAYLSGSNQSYTTNTSQIVALNAKEFDTDSRFNATGSVVNSIPAYSFMPNVAGYYQINACIYHNGAVYSAQLQTMIYKNGSSFKSNLVVAQGAILDGTVAISALVYFNGSTDYVSLYGSNSQATPFFSAGPASTFFSGSLVRAA
jgi:chemotaxis protein histidine kinase CheA